MKKIGAMGRPNNNERLELIKSMRKQRKGLTAIAKAIGITPQGVAYYINKYGDYEEFMDKKPIA